MSHNQSRADTREAFQYRRTGRSGSFNQHLGGNKGSGGGGGGRGAAPPVSSTTNPSLSSNRSFNKKYNNAQGGQHRVSGASTGSDSHQNGAHHQQQQALHGASDVPVTSANAPVPGAPVKQTDASTQKITRAVPRAPTSNVAASTSESTAPVTPAKTSGDASRSFPLQFGSISPGVMNVLQIPARTSSAPPNLDEQKRAQARSDTSRAIPSLPTPSTSNQPMPRKDAGPQNQSNPGESHGVAAKPKRDVQVSAPPAVTQTQKPSAHPMPGMHMQIPFHQPPQVPVQFGGPGPQIPSHSMSATSLPMPMHLPIGTPPMQQPMFVSGLQPHPMQSQGMMHQGQGLSFSSGMGPQLPPQLGNMGMNMPSQFPQQQAGKYLGARKTVKITHPDTHEELRLDGTPGSMSHPNMPPQSQPIASFPPGHPINYYPNSYNSSSVYFQAPSSLPLNNPQSSQPPRLFSQVTVKPAARIHPEKEHLPSVSSAAFGKDQVRLSKPPGGDSAHPQKDMDTLHQSSSAQSKIGNASKSASRPVANIQSIKVADSISEQSPAAGVSPLTSQAPSEPSVSVITDSSVDATTETLGVLEPTEDQQKKQAIRGQVTMQDKALGKSTSVSSPPSQYPLTGHVEVKTAASLGPAALGNSRENLAPSESVVLKSCITGDSGKEVSPELLDSRNLVAGMPVPKTGDRYEVTLPEVGEQGENNISKPSSGSLLVKSVEVSGLTEEGSPEKATNANIESGQPETGEEDTNASAGSTGVDSMADSITSSTCNQNFTDTEACTSAIGLSAQDDQASDIADPEEAAVTESAVVSQESASNLVKNSDEATSKCEDENTEADNTGVAKSSSGVKEKSLVDSNVPKVTAAKGKMKKKDLYKKADAAGATSDLYMAYKGPEKKDELAPSVEAGEITSKNNSKPLSDDAPQEDLTSTKKVGEVKTEPDDWEDAADISTPKLEAAPEHGKQVDGEDGDGMTTKKYSRDFLFKFAEQCIDIPEGFQVPSDIADILINAKISVSREPCPSPGRALDRPSSGLRERRGGGIGDGDKWSKMSGPLMPGRDIQPDLVYGGNVMGFRPGPGGNCGVSRHPRAPMPIAQFAGGILPGPMQSMGPHGGVQRNGVDADRWQRGTAFQKGLMPSPQTPAKIMHKAERKYEVGKITDEEQAKQRQLKAILNKLTPQNFEKLFQQVKEVNIDNDVTLNGVISQIFDKALMEPTFCEMYANFCQHLAAELPDLSVDNEKITFKRLLLNKCQVEFERGEREEQEANVTNEEGEVKLSAEEREEKRVKARRRMLGNIRLIGELYKKRMLTERIMHECIKKLLGDYHNLDEENIEALCKLMSTIGEMIDHAKAKEHMDVYFDRMEKLSNNMKLSSRVRFMLKDSIDLRKNKWQQRRKVEGPKKIEEVHRDAAQERHAQATRLARTPSLGVSARRGQPMDFAPRGSMLSSPGSQMGGFRPVSPQVRGFGMQDVRVDERHSFENRTLSLPLTQRPLGDDPITLGPQGGLAKGMSSRGQPAAPSIPFTDNVPNFGDSRRMTHAQNGYGLPERAPYASREELMPKYMPDRFYSQHDQASAPERNLTYGSRDRGFDTSRPASPPVRSGGPISTQNFASEKVWSEERLRDMSMAAIKEFYSAKDEKEVALCVKDLNAPNFYPSMISIWVTDSFERKDMERDHLAKLLISLAKSQDVTISQDQLVKGFESVLVTLEDAVNDAPRAAEFLGRIFAKVILENVLPFNEVGHLIYKGGEEEGRLVEIGLAAEVLGSALEVIKLEKGESVVSEICRSSNMRLENFRPPGGSNKQWKLDKFI
ncbi:eukaryotic translation initiation factor 4G isoform X1 [Nicotiana tomentosiformis]|uniref:eukaryotic translation initiation factor 4G isoform X1 n=1 Tax=Nicotiana tomentosiformis TaxID=4098 RepID=UPI00051CA764|nr:eukaryotic translation initiation factor 4G isoform X1 [Nicotiana tomentosiformis]XP_009594044.1 eukaryotic translation initiation factor 4G isoform X1 [Nicotiana tomentosiformis]